jgi:hypothetical protein
MSQIASALKKFSDDVKTKMNGWTPTTGSTVSPFSEGLTHLLNTLDTQQSQSRTFPVSHRFATIPNLACHIDINFRATDNTNPDAFSIEIVSIVQPPNNEETLAEAIMVQDLDDNTIGNMYLYVPNKKIHDALVDCGIRLGRIMQLKKINLKQVDLLVTHDFPAGSPTQQPIPNFHIFFQLFNPDYFSNLPGNFAKEKTDEGIPDSKNTILYVKDFLAKPPANFVNNAHKQNIDNLINQFKECGTTTLTQASKEALDNANAHVFSDKATQIAKNMHQRFQKVWEKVVVKPIKYGQSTMRTYLNTGPSNSQATQTATATSQQSQLDSESQPTATNNNPVIEELEQPLFKAADLQIFSNFITNLEKAVNQKSQGFYNARLANMNNSTNINNNAIVNPPTDRQHLLWPKLWDNIIQNNSTDPQWKFPDLNFENIIFEIDPQNGTCTPNGGLLVQQNGGGAIRVGGGPRRRPHRSRHRRGLSRRNRMWSRRRRHRTQQQLQTRTTAKKIQRGYYYRKTLKRQHFM